MKERKGPILTKESKEEKRKKYELSHGNSSALLLLFSHGQVVYHMFELLCRINANVPMMCLECFDQDKISLCTAFYTC